MTFLWCERFLILVILQGSRARDCSRSRLTVDSSVSSMTSQNDISRLGEFSSAEEIAKREKFRRKLLEKARLRDEEWQRRTAVYREKNIQDLPGYWKITGVANTPNTAVSSPLGGTFHEDLSRSSLQKELSPLKRIKNSCADVRSDNTGGCTQEVASAPIEKTESATGKGHAGRLTFHLERHGRSELSYASSGQLP